MLPLNLLVSQSLSSSTEGTHGVAKRRRLGNKLSAIEKWSSTVSADIVGNAEGSVDVLVAKADAACEAE
jgi:hypothetical protein